MSQCQKSSIIPPDSIKIHLPINFNLMGNRSGQPLAIDLFSGCGGVTQGLKWAGFEVLAAVDTDDLAIETYIKNHPDVTVWEGDIRCIPPSHMMSMLSLKPGELDLLAGCPPCQGYSSMRTLNGSRIVQDERNDLVFDFMRYIEAFKPEIVMLENVPALATDERMTQMLAKLKELGYYVDDQILRILNVAYYGVAQRRRRMILLTSLHGPVRFAPPDEKSLHVRDMIADLPQAGKSGDPLHDFTENRSERILNLISLIPQDGGSRTDLGEEYQLECHKKCEGFNDVYGRMSWDDVAPTITSGCTNPSKGRFLHPTENRAITLREAALLQSFPQNYYFSLRRGKSGAALLIGNALPPKFIEKHAVEIKDHLHSQVHQSEK